MNPQINSEIDLNEKVDALIPELLEKVDLLESQGIVVQSQPLGFMRLALDGQKNNQEGYFLHVWIPGLPTQEGGPFIHTHVFDLTSRVVFGTIRDTIYTPKSDVQGEYQLVGATCAEDYCLPFHNDQGKVNMETSCVLEVFAGNVYEVPKNTFHETTIVSDIAVTLMKKYNVENKDPILAVPVGVPIPKDTFRRDQIDQAFAWKTIRELLERSRDNSSSDRKS